MNIAHITESKGVSGGTEQLSMLAAGLRKNGHTVYLICRPGSMTGELLGDAGINVEYVPMRQDYDVFSALKVRKFLREKKIDILHSHHSRAHSIGLIAALGMDSVKFAVTRRVIFRLRKNIFSVLKYKSKRIDRYIAVSAAVKKNLTDYGIDGKRVSVIYSATDTERFTPAIKTDLRRRLGLSESDFVCCMAGNYSRYKGHDIFLLAASEILKKYPNTKFLIAGKADDSLSVLARKLKIENSVIFLGFRRDVPEVLKASNLLVCPSLQEGLAGAVREAMSVGLPSVVTDAGGNAEIVRDEETGFLVEPGNPHEIADSVAYLIENPRRAAEMGAAGRKRVIENFSAGAMLSRHEKLYSELMNE